MTIRASDPGPIKVTTSAGSIEGRAAILVGSTGPQGPAGPRGPEGPAGGATANDSVIASNVSDPASQTRSALSSAYTPRWQPSVAYTAGQPVVNPFGDVVTAKTSFTSGTTYDSTKWNLSSTYVARTGSLSTLPNPAYFAHRGSSNVYPEETMTAFRASVATGVDGIEMDIQKLGDGTPVAMHDPTVDRTTNGAGTVASYTTPSWYSLNAAAKIPWPTSERPALWPEIVNEFGGKTPLLVEPKDVSTLAALVAYTDAAALQQHVVYEVSDLTTLAAVKAAGYRAYFFYAGSSIASPTPAAVVAAGADYIGGPLAMTDADITTLVATGKPVWMYTFFRRTEVTRALGLGVKGLLSDQPHYIKRTTAVRTVDSWRDGVWGHGLNTNRAALPGIVNGTLQLATSAGATEAVTIGEVSPVANAAASYTVDIDAGFSTLPTDTTRAVDLTVGIADDGQTPSTNAAGWNAFMRANGSFALFKNGVQVGSAVTTPVLQNPTLTSALAAGAAVTSLPVAALTVAVTAGMQFWLPTTGQIAVASGSAAVGATAIPVNSITPTATVPTGAVLAQMAHIRIAVTPTTVTATRTDTASTPVTTTDSAFRGGYVAIRRFSTANGVGIFKNLAIT